MLHTHLRWVGIIITLLGIPYGFTPVGHWILPLGIILFLLGFVLSKAWTVRVRRNIAKVLYLATIVCFVMLVIAFFTSNWPSPIEGLFVFGRLFNAHPFLPIARASSSIWNWLAGWIGWLLLTIAVWFYGLEASPSRKELRKAGLI